MGERKILFYLGGAFMLGVGLVAFEFASETWVRWLAFFALVALPVVGYASYQLGLTEARGRLRGIDQGVERVTDAAATAINLRASSVGLMRQATRSEPLPVDLPQVGPSITVRRLESGEVEL